MINLSKLATNVLNSIDNAAKETLVEQSGKQQSATEIRAQRRTTIKSGKNLSASDAVTTGEEGKAEVTSDSVSPIEEANDTPKPSNVGQSSPNKVGPPVLPTE